MNGIELITSALGWALVHSIWQITLIGLLVRVILALFWNHPAYRKHFIVLAGMIIMFLSFTGTTAIYISEGDLSGSKELSSAHQQEVLMTSIGPKLLSVDPGAQRSSVLYQTQRYIAENIHLITGIWLLGLLVFLVRFTGSSLYIHRLRSKYAIELDKKWHAVGNQIRNNMIIRRTIRILESDQIGVPITTGILHPVIILPLGLVTHIPFNQLEAVLVHEMAHIKRNDYLINILRSFLEAMFFYHPVFWWLSGKLEIYREHACDDITIHHCGSPEPLQKALLDLYSATPDTLNPAAALFKNSNQLLNRIKRMKTNHNNPNKSGSLASFLLAPAVLLTLAIASAFAPRMTDYPELTNPMKPPVEIRSANPSIPSNITQYNADIEQTNPRKRAQTAQLSIPDSTKKGMGVKANTKEGYILLEFDENMNIRKITKNGKELEGKEKEKYLRFADKTKRIFEEEENLKERQKELEALEGKLEEVQKNMQEVQEEYSELWQSYREKSMLNGQFHWPEAYADVFGDIDVAPPSVNTPLLTHPFYGDVPVPFDSLFPDPDVFYFDQNLDSEEFEERLQQSIKLYEDAFRKQEQEREKRMQEFLQQQQNYQNKSEQYQIKENQFRVFEEKVRSELLQDELTDAWDDLESFELSGEYLKVDGKKQSKKLHKKYLDLYKSVMDKKLEGKIEIH